MSLRYGRGASTVQKLGDLLKCLSKAVATPSMEFQQVASVSWELFSWSKKLMFEFDASSSITLYIYITKKIIMKSLKPNCCCIFKCKTIEH